MAYSDSARSGTAEEALSRHVEVTVADLFRQLLDNGGEFSGDSDFFLSGGNSLLGARLVALLRRTFGVKVTIRDVFRARTVGAIAQVVTDRGEQR